MSEYVKNLMSRWISYFSKQLLFENSKSGFNKNAAQLSVVIELMKEQVPNENTHSTTG